MRAKPWLLGLMLLPTLGCTHMNNTQQGALSGAALGTVAGAFLGGGRGALAGAAVGTAAGALVGNSEDRHDHRRATQVAAVRTEQARRQMTLSEVVQMAQRQVSDTVIIDQIRYSGSVFNLRGEDIIYLRDQGVSDRVVNEMQRSGPRMVVVEQRPVYVVPPPPPPHVGFGMTVVR